MAKGKKNHALRRAIGLYEIDYIQKSLGNVNFQPHSVLYRPVWPGRNLNLLSLSLSLFCLTTQTLRKLFLPRLIYFNRRFAPMCFSLLNASTLPPQNQPRLNQTVREEILLSLHGSCNVSNVRFFFI